MGFLDCCRHGLFLHVQSGFQKLVRVSDELCYFRMFSHGHCPDEFLPDFFVGDGY